MTRLLPLLLIAGCAPGFGLRPVGGVPAGHGGEVGLGAAAISPRPLQETPWSTASVGWWTWRSGESTSLSVLGAWDGEHGALGLGGEWRLVQAEESTIGVGLEAGWIWAALDLPVAVRLSERAGLYASPGVGFWGFDVTPQARAGLQWQLVEAADQSVVIRAEGAATYPDLDPFKRRIHLAVGVALQR